VVTSPDVVLNGDATLNHNLLLERWNSSFWDLIVGLVNFCGARAQSVNFELPIQSPRVRMFSTQGGFNPPPGSWQILNTDGDDDPVYSVLTGYGDPPTQPGERVASKDSFIFEPQANVHHCLLAVVSSEFFTNDPTKLTGNWDTLAWLLNNGSAGWRNVNPQTTVDTALKIYNADGVPERFSFEAHCHNLPAGTRVSLTASDAALEKGVDTGPVEVTRDYQRIATGVATLPADYAGDLVVRVETRDGGLLPPDASIDLRMHWVLGTGHTRYDDATKLLRAHREAAAGAELRVPVGGYVLTGAKPK
jgi:hypothetical protein